MKTLRIWFTGERMEDWDYEEGTDKWAVENGFLRIRDRGNIRYYNIDTIDRMIILGDG